MIEKQQIEMQKRQIEKTKNYQNSIKTPSMPYQPHNSHTQVRFEEKNIIMPQSNNKTQYFTSEPNTSGFPSQISPSNDYNMTNKNIEQAYNKKASNKCEQIKTDLNISEIKSNKLPFKIKAYFIFRYCRNCFKVKETDETPYLCDCGYTTCSICKRDPHENLSCQNFW